MKLIDQYRGLRKEIYVLGICELIDCAGSMVGPLLTLILSSKLGMDASAIALYFLIYTVLSLPIHLLGGKLTDRMNKKLLINICDITTSVIYIICGLAGINKVTITCYLFGSLLQAAESPAYQTLTADFTTSADRDKAYSLHYLAMNLGMVLAPTLGGLLMKDHLGFMFVLSGCVQLLSILIFDLFVKDMSAVKDSENKYEEESSSGNVIRVLMENRALIPFVLIYAFSMLFYGMYGYLMPLSFTAVHGDVGSVLYGTVSSLNCVTVLVFTAALTAMFAKRTSIDKMIWGNAFEVFGMLMIFLFLGTPVVYYIAIVIFTFGEILNTTTTSPHLTRRIPANFRGRIMAVASVFVDLVMSAGEFAVGKVYDNVNPEAAWISVLCLGAATIAGYILLKKPDRKAYPELYKE